MICPAGFIKRPAWRFIYISFSDESWIMNLEEIREYCLEKSGVTEGFPFNDTVLVFKVSGKIFALLDLSEESRGISLNCEPGLDIEPRGQHPDVTLPIILTGSFGSCFVL